MSMRQHDVVVVGGGPAGSAAAIALAKGGTQVSLLERKSGAHDKVCGEFISWEAAQYLDELGLDLPALGALPIRQVALYNGDDAFTSQLPALAWSLSRRQLDAALLQTAQDAGVDVRQGVAVRELSRGERGWRLGTAAQGSAEKRGALSAETVFLACGKHDLRHWQRSPTGRSSESIGLKMHLRLSQSQQRKLDETVEVHLYDGGYAGLEPIEGGKANLCFLINKSIYKACNYRWQQVVDWLGEVSPHLQSRLAGATPLWQQPLAVSSVPYGYRHSPADAVPQLYRVGDQAAVIPSFAGDGISIALHSAYLATRVYASGGDSKDYLRQARTSLYRPVRDAQFLAGLLSTRPGRNVALCLSRQWPGLFRSVISRLRVKNI